MSSNTTARAPAIAGNTTPWRNSSHPAPTGNIPAYHTMAGYPSPCGTGFQMVHDPEAATPNPQQQAFFEYWQTPNGTWFNGVPISGRAAARREGRRQRWKASPAPTPPEKNDNENPPRSDSPPAPPRGPTSGSPGTGPHPASVHTVSSSSSASSSRASSGSSASSSSSTVRSSSRHDPNWPWPMPRHSGSGEPGSTAAAAGGSDASPPSQAGDRGRSNRGGGISEQEIEKWIRGGVRYVNPSHGSQDGGSGGDARGARPGRHVRFSNRNEVFSAPSEAGSSIPSSGPYMHGALGRR